MTKSIALLRGVNVGGRNMLPMKSFAAALEGLGCENVRTYIQSGNAVYDGAPTSKDIAAAIKKAAGFAPPVFVLTLAALKKAAKACPFRKEAEMSGKSVHLFFLEKAPSKAGVVSLGDLKRPNEDFAVAGRVLYLYAGEGVADSKIAVKIDRVLETTTTARNWNTVMKLIELAEIK
ncbi:MAG: DUF1697 domain-containing protein [Parvularculaceae bacterium]